MEIGPAKYNRGVAGWRSSQVFWAGKGLGPPTRCTGGSSPLEPRRNCIRLRWVGWPEDKKRPDFRQGRTGFRLSNALPSERFHHRQNNDRGHQNCRYLIDKTVEFLRVPIAVGGKVFHPARAGAVQPRKRYHERQFGQEPSRSEPSVARIR